jgi:hypothetical protein
VPVFSANRCRIPNGALKDVVAAKEEQTWDTLVLVAILRFELKAAYKLQILHNMV